MLHYHVWLQPLGAEIRALYYLLKKDSKCFILSSLALLTLTSMSNVFLVAIVYLTDIFRPVVMPSLEFWEIIASMISSDGLNQLNQLNQRNAAGTITQALSSLLPILVHQCKFTRDVVPEANVSESARRYINQSSNKILEVFTHN